MSTSHPVLRRLVAACVVSLALTACEKDGSSGPPEGAAQPASGGHAALSQPEIFGVALALNAGEVEQATAVQGRLRDASAQRFAEQMTRDHSAAIEQLNALSSELAILPADSSLRHELVSESQEVLRRLHAASPGDVDEEYLASQVAMHRRALDVYDNHLIPTAEQDRLRRLLTTQRGHIEAHLQQAEQLQSK